MKLSEYIKALQNILKTEGELPLFCAIDEEGNGFYQMTYIPEIRYAMSDDVSYGRSDSLLTLNDIQEEYEDEVNDFVKVVLL